MMDRFGRIPGNPETARRLRGKARPAAVAPLRSPFTYNPRMPTSDLRAGACGIRTVCFDVDGTLVHHPEGKTVWQVLNERFLGNDQLNKERFSAFRSGRITYAEWVALDIGDWMSRGIRRGDIEAVIHEQLGLVAGARETMDELRVRGYRLAVISGTLDLTLELLLDGFPFDRVFTNRIFFGAGGAIDGWEATPYDVDGKARALRKLATSFGHPPGQCAFVGDHWNDLAALGAAGLGIAFCPKDDVVRRAADVVVEEGPLTRLLPLFPEVRR
jgi:phosphoserine phosphatase